MSCDWSVRTILRLLRTCNCGGNVGVLQTRDGVVNVAFTTCQSHMLLYDLMHRHALVCKQKVNH